MIPKFRAWDKAHEVMRNVLLIDLFSRSIICETEDERNIKLYVTTYELMQSTGTKDINGVDIYEGDVVKSNRTQYGRFIGFVDNAVAKFKVRGVKQYAYLSDELDGAYEVIGNIYETPHLLEDE